MLKLAGPVVLAEVGWVTMGTGGHGHRRTAGPGSDRRGRHRQHPVPRPRHFRHGSPARPRDAGVARVRRRAAGRVPPLAAPRRDPEPPRDAAAHRRRRGAGPAAAVLGPAAGGAGPHDSLRQGHHVEPAAAAALRLVPPLPPGARHRRANHRGARHGECHQRGGRLGAGVRTLRPARHGHDRVGRRDARVAHLPRGRAARVGRRLRSAPSRQPVQRDLETEAEAACCGCCGSACRRRPR